MSRRYIMKSLSEITQTQSKYSIEASFSYQTKVKELQNIAPYLIS